MDREDFLSILRCIKSSAPRFLDESGDEHDSVKLSSLIMVSTVFKLLCLEGLETFKWRSLRRLALAIMSCRFSCCLELVFMTSNMVWKSASQLRCTRFQYPLELAKKNSSVDSMASPSKK